MATINRRKNNTSRFKGGKFKKVKKPIKRGGRNYLAHTTEEPRRPRRSNYDVEGTEPEKNATTTDR